MCEVTLFPEDFDIDFSAMIKLKLSRGRRQVGYVPGFLVPCIAGLFLELLESFRAWPVDVRAPGGDRMGPVNKSVELKRPYQWLPVIPSWELRVVPSLPKRPFRVSHYCAPRPQRLQSRPFNHWTMNNN